MKISFLNEDGIEYFFKLFSVSNSNICGTFDGLKYNEFLVKITLSVIEIIVSFKSMFIKSFEI